MKIGIVTGASSGIGREFVKQISEKFRTLDEIWVIARSKNKLESLRFDIKEPYIRVIAADITTDKGLNMLRQNLRLEKPSIRVLVNSAGYGTIGHYDELTEDENAGMCELNCVALTRITSICLPYMSKPFANIINMASSAAFAPQPSFAVYAASKAYVLSLSRALNKELSDRGITVTAVCPGPVDTEFFDKAEKYHEVMLYKKLFRVKAKRVVKLALFDAYYMMNMSVCGITMKAFYVISKIVPIRIILKFIK